MVSVNVATPITGVAIGDKHDLKDEAVRHWIRKVHNVSEVTTICGAKITALPSTWQPSRECRRCPESGAVKNPILISTVVGWDFIDDAHDFYGEWEKRRLLHALQTIKNPNTSKKFARKVAVALGYAHPELILEDFPELRKHIVYIRPPKKLL